MDSVIGKYSCIQRYNDVYILSMLLLNNKILLLCLSHDAFLMAYFVSEKYYRFYNRILSIFKTTQGYIICWISEYKGA